MKAGPRTALAAVALVATAFCLAYGGPLLTLGGGDARLVDSVRPDEMDHVAMVHDALVTGSLRHRDNFFGHLHLNLTAVPLLVVDRWWDVGDTEILFTLRAWALFFAAATAVAAFVLAKRFFSTGAAWLAFVLVLLQPELLRISLESRPDSAQTFFVLLTLYFICHLAEEYRLRWLLASSLAAGVTFATKFGGAILLPLIGGVALLHAVRRKPSPEGGDPVLLHPRLSGVAVLACLGAAVLLRPPAADTDPVAAVLMDEEGRVVQAAAFHGAEHDVIGASFEELLAEGDREGFRDRASEARLLRRRRAEFRPAAGLGPWGEDAWMRLTMAQDPRGLAGLIHVVDGPPVEEANKSAALAKLQVASLGAAGLAALSLLLLGLRRRRGRVHPLARVFGEVTNAGFLVAAAFTLAFGAVSPSSLHRWAFLDGLVGVSNSLGGGGVMADSVGTRGWTSLTVGLVGLPVAALAIVALVRAVWAGVARRSAPGGWAPLVLLWAWIGTYMVVLGTRIQTPTTHYLNPILPALLVLAAVGAVEVAERAARVAPTPARRPIVVAALAALAVLVVPLRELEAQRALARGMFTDTPRLAAGEWLRGHVPGDAEILYEPLTYVPSELPNAFERRHYGRPVDDRRFDAVVVDWCARQRYATSEVRSARPAEFEVEQSFHGALADGSRGLSLAADFGEVRVYDRHEHAARGTVFRASFQGDPCAWQGVAP